MGIYASIVKGNFGRHDFSVKWTFGEMIFSGPNSGAAGAFPGYRCLQGHGRAVGAAARQLKGKSCRQIHGTAAHMDVPDCSVDLVCIDPATIMHAELSDYFYVAAATLRSYRIFSPPAHQ